MLGSVWHYRVVPDVDASFDQLVGEHRRELYVHGYRLLASVDDAEDALQEALLAAWRGSRRSKGAARCVLGLTRTPRTPLRRD